MNYTEISNLRNLIESYGHDVVKYYDRVKNCWFALSKWSKINLPSLLTTFNDCASFSELNLLKKEICTNSMISNNNYKYLTPYLIFLGSFCNGQNRKLSRMGMYGYYTFYNKSSSGHLLSIFDGIKYRKQVYDVYDVYDVYGSD